MVQLILLCLLTRLMNWHNRDLCQKQGLCRCSQRRGGRRRKRATVFFDPPNYYCFFFILFIRHAHSFRLLFWVRVRDGVAPQMVRVERAHLVDSAGLNGLNPGVTQDLGHLGPQGWIDLEHPAHDRTTLSGQQFQEAKFTVARGVHKGLEGRVDIGLGHGPRESAQAHTDKDDAKGPDVRSGGVMLFSKDFRRDVGIGARDACSVCANR